jgi:leader peptidase (prepilin peptidase)/N-methyltransferase
MSSIAPLLPLFLIVVAPFVGSFVGLVAARLPHGGTILLGRSVCPNCHTQLGVLDLIPIVSWLGLGGRCLHCGAGLDPLDLVAELAALLLAIWAATLMSGWPLLWTCLLGWCLIGLAIIDYRHLLIPDVFPLLLLPAGLLVTWTLAPERLPGHVIGALAGFSLLALLGLAYHRYRGRAGLGLGDAKLLAAAGAWVGWQGLASVVLEAALAGLITVLAFRLITGESWPAARPLPFGPFLALGFWVTWLHGPLQFV